MPVPVTPLVGCDVFVLNNKNELLLIKRSDNGFWALPGGCHDLGESPRECAIRECLEESGLKVEIQELLGVFSSSKYEYVHYPWKDLEFCHILFRAKLIGGQESTSEETLEVKWFKRDSLPPLSDGHRERIAYAFKKFDNPNLPPYFE